MLIAKQQRIYKTIATIALFFLFLFILFVLYEAVRLNKNKHKLSCAFDPFVTQNAMEIENLNFTGVNKQEAQYQIHISQVLHNMDNIYFGQNIDIQYPIGNDEILSILATQGAFYSDQKTINLRGGALLLYRSWQINANTIDIHLIDRVAYGRDGVSLKLDEKKMKCYISAEQFQVHDQEVILDKNHVRIILPR